MRPDPNNIWSSPTPDCDRTLRALFEEAIEQLKSAGLPTSTDNVLLAVDYKTSRAFSELASEKIRIENERKQ